MAEEQGFVKMAQDRKLRVVEVMPPAGGMTKPQERRNHGKVRDVWSLQTV